jgi:UDP-N-acetyl-alpha-D-muramoyl-L-alanyl-L-glutamate epimerase
MNRYKQFIFNSYHFNIDSKTLDLHYSFDDNINLTETYHFDFDFVDYDPPVLDRACQLLFFMAGVSYYKKFIPHEIVVRRGSLDPFLAKFFSKTYERGLGEFWFVNKLDPRTPVTFPVSVDAVTALQSTKTGKGPLVGIGGGKDSLVSVELLRDQVPDMATWSVSHKQQLAPLIERIGLPHYWVERTWDRQLLDLRDQGGLSGHVPISGILACAGIVTAILAGKQDVVVSNEQSANEPDFVYQGVPINHQYSKSQEFEYDFQQVLKHLFGAVKRTPHRRIICTNGL